MRSLSRLGRLMASSDVQLVVTGVVIGLTLTMIIGAPGYLASYAGDGTLVWITLVAASTACVVRLWAHIPPARRPIKVEEGQ